ncbi:MAG: signal recognition particle-docking protein FtsY [Sandaracinaceae bacterium]|nr:signal recognition particle-docking protein FtsY [Sandaracinaceae bacterium]
MVVIVAVVVALILLGAALYFLQSGKKSEPLPPADKPALKSEEAKKEAPKKDPPKAETKPEAKKPEPKKPEPKAEAPKIEPKAEAPKDEPKAEPAKTDAPKPQKAEVAEAPAPKAEAARVEAPEPASPPKVEAPVRPARQESPESIQALKKGLATTRGGFIARLAQLFGRKKEIDPALLDEVQTVLLSADIGPRTAEKMLEGLRSEIVNGQHASEEAVWASLRRRAAEILGPSQGAIVASKKPTVIVVVGVNGVGKTTTIGKLASRYQEEGKKVVLAAGDTFRAAAVLQLEVWGKRVGCEVVKGKDRADPGAVIFDAIKKGVTDGADVVIADTAGRLHTKSNLMEELKKVVRTAEKALERPLDEILLVLDATTGQNAIQQVQLFREAIPVSGIVLTKLDGTAKGGVVLGVANEHQIPVRYVGIGERVEDLRAFDAETFVAALFEKPEEAV